LLVIHLSPNQLNKRLFQFLITRESTVEIRSFGHCQKRATTRCEIDKGTHSGVP
jgi:hypothetical protein